MPVGLTQISPPGPLSQIFSYLYEDTVHPSRAGELLLADLLINYLATAEAHIHYSEKAEPRPTPRPMFQASNRVPLIRCYGVELDVAAWANTSDSAFEIGIEAGASGEAMKVTRCGHGGGMRPAGRK